MVFSHIPDTSGRVIQPLRITWSEVRAKLTGPGVHASKEACPLFKLASFGNNRTIKGSLRSDDNLDQIFGVEADYDGGRCSVEDAGDMLARVGIEALIYTSPRHTPDAPRWRVVAPLSSPCSKSERRALAGVLNAALGGILADESFTASQSYYYGRVRGAPFEFRHVCGATLDHVAFTTPERYPEKAICCG
jgi:hypothetical protein